MKNRYLNILLLPVFVLGLNACSHTNFKEFVGPALCPTSNFAYSTPFTALSNNSQNQSNVDFGIAEFVTFNASFTEKVSWTLKIKGQKSNAVKTYTGNSTSFNLVWNGEQDSLKFFQVENVDVSLSIACLPVIKKTISIVGKPTFAVPGKFLLVSDFDGNGVVTSWYTYGTILTNKSIVSLPDSISSPQGGSCFNLTGNSAGVPVWFFGGFGNNTSFVNSLGLMSQSPDSIYCNVFLWSNNKINSDVQINLTEGVLKRLKRVTATWSGWKMFSFKLSEAGVINTSKVSGIDFGLGTAPAQSTTAEINVDFIIFTKGSPFLNQ
ncbi:MAG: hypothetical protein K2Q22_12515 [Cytophagales bacterium]|nr:hypothetical protein [Cytophagales bacterium]